MLRPLLVLFFGAATASEALAESPSSRRYQATWASLDSRPTPTWWSDAKFGIFIHWGVYSVPGFAPKGEYAEWYWERIGRAGNPDPASPDAKIRQQTRAFHERVYGKDFQYPDFAAQFRAEMFDADEWADTLQRSGAKRVVDVRVNNSSQLAGFSKRDDLEFFLKAICGMEYTHAPEFAPTQEMLDAYRGKHVNWA